MVGEHVKVQSRRSPRCRAQPSELTPTLNVQRFLRADLLLSIIAFFILSCVQACITSPCTLFTMYIGRRVRSRPDFISAMKCDAVVLGRRRTRPHRHSLQGKQDKTGISACGRGTYTRCCGSCDTHAHGRRRHICPSFFIFYFSFFRYATRGTGEPICMRRVGPVAITCVCHPSMWPGSVERAGAAHCQWPFE